MADKQIIDYDASTPAPDDWALMQPNGGGLYYRAMAELLGKIFGVTDNVATAARTFNTSGFVFTITATGEDGSVNLIVNGDEGDERITLLGSAVSGHSGRVECTPYGFILEAFDGVNNLEMRSVLAAGRPTLRIRDVREFADNAAAIAAGLTAGCVYHSAGALRIVI